MKALKLPKGVLKADQDSDLVKERIACASKFVVESRIMLKNGIIYPECAVVSEFDSNTSTWFDIVLPNAQGKSLRIQVSDVASVGCSALPCSIQENFRISQGRLILAIIVSFLFGGGCSSEKVVLGRVIMLARDEAHINLGSEDGLKVGDTLLVWRMIEDEQPATGTPKVVVRVIRILGNNYSVVQPVQGTIKEGDIVEKPKHDV